MMRLSMSRRQQPKVTPVVPFKNKIRYYQLKQSFLITRYNKFYSFKILNFKAKQVFLPFTSFFYARMEIVGK
jgi:hypothetical protein